MFVVHSPQNISSGGALMQTDQIYTYTCAYNTMRIYMDTPYSPTPPKHILHSLFCTAVRIRLDAVDTAYWYGVSVWIRIFPYYAYWTGLDFSNFATRCSIPIFKGPTSSFRLDIDDEQIKSWFRYCITKVCAQKYASCNSSAHKWLTCIETLA